MIGNYNFDMEPSMEIYRGDEVIAASERTDLMTCCDVLRLYDGELVDVVSLRQKRLVLQVLMVVETYWNPAAYA